MFNVIRLIKGIIGDVWDLEGWQLVWKPLVSYGGCVLVDNKQMILSTYLEESELEKVIIHECCHILTQDEKKEHGKEFYRLFGKYGYTHKDRTCYVRRPLLKAKTGFYCYYCCSDMHFFKNVKRYKCRKCGRFSKKEYAGN